VGQRPTPRDPRPWVRNPRSWVRDPRPWVRDPRTWVSDPREIDFFRTPPAGLAHRGDAFPVRGTPHKLPAIPGPITEGLQKEPRDFLTSCANARALKSPPSPESCSVGAELPALVGGAVHAFKAQKGYGAVVDNFAHA